ncbi:nuclear transport factor 2 family protein [Longispora albida]|uniref:nuclear transport factor 2 family protein n=1 Tax=Longispora albida TaxID=203523 RepID=UPI00036A888E|nr:nuclear transport factor 2 family protein [Longispora albida]
MPDAAIDIMHRFNEAFLRHDPAILAGLVAEDCVIENTDGTRHAGRAACLALWSGIAGAADTEFEPEEVWAAGDRAVIRWRLRWGPGLAESFRGVNLMRVRDGLIVEAMGYVKG